MAQASDGRRTAWSVLGPGILFAGAAVGVSHLVQSTRAGAAHGLGLILVVVAANVLKYPAFRFGPQYAAATRTSLLEGYRRQGRWALALYGLLTLGTMFAVLAAVTLVTAGLAKVLFRLETSPLLISAVLLAACGLLAGVGRYRWLDRIVKVLVAVLTVATVAATVAALVRTDWGAVPLWPTAATLDRSSILFIAALVGWMPSAIDVAVWQSLWTLAREHDTGHAPSLRESMLDFHVGYVATAVLALCFVVLGAAVMHGHELEATPGGFAGQVIALYTTTLGGWSRPLIGAAATCVMFSTTLTVVDGFPRALTILAARLRGPEQPGAVEEDRRENRRVYWLVMIVLALGALVLLAFFLRSLKAMVDLATTLSFLTAPILAWLNHRCVASSEVPAELRPGRGLLLASGLGVVFLSLFALYYAWVRFA